MRQCEERVRFRMVQTGSAATFDLIVDGVVVATGLKIAEDMHPLFLQISSVFRYWLPQSNGQPAALKG
jgi:hypothetical protein